MYCPHCGCQLPESANQCQRCGTVCIPSQPTVAHASVISPISLLKQKLSSSLFLALAILTSLSVMYSMGSQITINSFKFHSFTDVNVLGILFAIALWLAYINSKKEDFNPIGLKIASGTSKALYIITWIGIGGLFLGGLICIAIPGMFPNLINDLFSNDIWLRYSDGFDLQDLTAISGIGLKLISIMLSVGLWIFAVVLILVNIFFCRNLHIFLKSLYTSTETGNLVLVKTGVVRSWLIVLAVLSGISGLASLQTNGIGTLCAAAAYIIAFLWIKQLEEAIAQNAGSTPMTNTMNNN